MSIYQIAKRFVFISSAVFSLGMGSLFAQDDTSKEGADRQEQAEGGGVKVERGAGGKKVFRITTGFVIEGRIQKPNAFYVLQRSQINYDWASLKKDFLPNISEAARHHPF